MQQTDAVNGKQPPHNSISVRAGEVHLPIASSKELANGKTGSKLIPLWKRPEPAPMNWLIDGLVPEGFLSILYGNSDLGKSYVCLWLGLHVATGRDLPGQQIRERKVLWLDFEMNEDEAARRLWRVARGMGYTEPPSGIFYYKPEKPLGSKDLESEIAIEIERNDIELVIIDSLSIGASASDASEQRDMVSLLKSIESWGVTTIAIDHISKAAAGANQGNATIFGSTFKRAIARSTILLTPGGSPGLVVLQHTKNNFGQRSTNLFLELKFDTSGKEVSISQISESDPRAASAGEHMPAKEQVWMALIQAFRETNSPVPMDTLMEETGKSKARIQSYLSELGSKVIKHRNGTYTPSLET